VRTVGVDRSGGAEFVLRITGLSSVTEAGYSWSINVLVLQSEKNGILIRSINEHFTLVASPLCAKSLGGTY
jgi:hypothetical protein